MENLLRNYLPDRLLVLLFYKKTALFTIFVLLIIIEVGVYYFIKNSYETKTNEYLAYLKVQRQAEFTSVIKTYKIASKVQAQSLTTDTALKTIFKSLEDSNNFKIAHDELLVKFGHIYKSNQALSLKIFQIQNAKGDVLIRFQKPEAYGDNIFGFRKLIKDVHKSHQSLYGFELGRYFNAFRYVFPISDSGNFLGSIEVGIDESQMLETFKDNFNVDAYLSLEPSSEIFIFKNDMPILVKKLLKAKPNGFDIAIVNKQEVGFYAEIDNKHYAVIVKPFFDYSQKYVGYIIFYHQDKILPAMKEEFYYSLFTSMLAVLLFTVALYVLIREVKSNTLLAASVLERERAEKYNAPICQDNSPTFHL